MFKIVGVDLVDATPDSGSSASRSTPSQRSINVF